MKCKHTKVPQGYGEFMEWAIKKNKTHKNIQCKDCGLWAVWVRRKPPTSHTGKE